MIYTHIDYESIAKELPTEQRRVAHVCPVGEGKSSEITSLSKLHSDFYCKSLLNLAVGTFDPLFSEFVKPDHLA